MISQIQPTAGKANASVYQLKVVLIDSKPAIWRQLRVPGSASLGWLRAVFQVTMGWTNSHLHQFKAGGTLYSDTRHHFGEFEGDPEIPEERKLTLQQIAPPSHSRLCSSGSGSSAAP